MRTTTISADELKFCERSRRIFPQNPSRGVVGSYNMPQSGSYNLFIVVDYDKDIKCLHVIYPRIKIVDNKVLLGVDKMKKMSREEFYEVQPDYKYGIYYFWKDDFLEWEKKDPVSICRDRLDKSMLEDSAAGFPITTWNDLNAMINHRNMKELDEIHDMIKEIKIRSNKMWHKKGK